MPRIATGKVKVNIYLDEKVFEAMRRIGRARGITHSELIRDACRRYVLTEGGKVVQELVAMKQALT
jgi:metal-responsive CopG/Arc/MetJ family transcriptional regulator